MSEERYEPLSERMTEMLRSVPEMTYEESLHRPAVLAERAAIVAWLERKALIQAGANGDPHMQMTLNWAADAILRGDHLKDTAV